MKFLELESSRTAYRADFAVYALAVLGLSAGLLWQPPGPAWQVLAAVAAGYAVWSVLEYALHRFVLHGLQPFAGMHAQHHQRPTARIGTPTVVSAPLFALFGFAPLWAVAGLGWASAFTLGLLVGYLAYALTHHAMHRASKDGLGGLGAAGEQGWLARHQRWHVRHHQLTLTPGCYGVSHRFWDHIFGTANAPFGRTLRAVGRPPL